MADYTNNMNFATNVSPKDANSGTLGISTKPWATIYANNLLSIQKITFTTASYGTSLPSTGVQGQIFFKI